MITTQQIFQCDCCKASSHPTFIPGKAEDTFHELDLNLADPSYLTLCDTCYTALPNIDWVPGYTNRSVQTTYNIVSGVGIRLAQCDFEAIYKAHQSLPEECKNGDSEGPKINMCDMQLYLEDLSAAGLLDNINYEFGGVVDDLEMLRWYFTILGTNPASWAYFMPKFIQACKDLGIEVTEYDIKPIYDWHTFD